MCGRFTLKTPVADVARQFELFDAGVLEPRYNVAPSQPIAAVRMSAEGARELTALRWGLIPSWAKDAAIGYKMINARSESVAEKPSFRVPLRRRRCLVPADGFYEWQRTGKQKQPFYFTMTDAGPFAFAGLWDHWERDGQTIESCTLLTTSANELLAQIHDRMPVILPAEQYALWLDPAVQDPARLLPLLAPYPSEQMQSKPVSTWVNSPTHEGARCIESI